MGKYYAVRKGLNVGIYETWEECKKQVNGYKGAIYKSFPTRNEAENFLKEGTKKKEKYYAVRKGLNVGIYRTWEECKKQVVGYQGVEFKCFPTLVEAENFMKGELNSKLNNHTLHETKIKDDMVGENLLSKNPPLTGIPTTVSRKSSSPPISTSSLSSELKELSVEETGQEKQNNKVVAYIDGGYNNQTKEYSYGVVLFHKGKEYHFNEKFDNVSFQTMRNVAGKIEGSKKAISFCAENAVKFLDMYYDFEGIAKWARGEWHTNKPGTIAYKNFYDDMIQKHQLRVNFIKVETHSNNNYSDLANPLAKEVVFGHS